MMATNSTIEWTNVTWNPVTGCTRVSPGCDNCYAALMSFRLDNMGQSKYAGLTSLNAKGDRHFNGRVNLVENSLDVPLKLKKPRMIFVNSMSDLFHRDVPVEFIKRVFSVMNQAKQHTFQVLTKRSTRILELSEELEWADHIWLGVSVENEAVLSRVDDLVATEAKTKWLSVEPLLGPLPSLQLAGIDWVVVGGESGPKGRPMDVDWVRDIRERCVCADVPFFFKQWGHVRNNPKPCDPTAKENGGHAKGGRQLDGTTWNEYPTIHLEVCGT